MALQKSFWKFGTEFPKAYFRIDRFVYDVNAKVMNYFFRIYPSEASRQSNPETNNIEIGNGFLQNPDFRVNLIEQAYNHLKFSPEMERALDV
jgi:hypothetical protein